MARWAVAAVLCAPLAISMLTFWLLVHLGAEYPKMDEYRELLAHDFALPPEDDNVRRSVVFAASGMRCATSGPKRLPGANIDLTVLAGPRASLLDLHPLVGPTVAARPSFVVVHSSILALAPRSPVKKAFTVARTFWDRQAGVFIQSFVRDDLSGRDDTRASKRLVPVFPCLPNAVPVGLWRDQTGQAIRKRALAGRQRAKMRALLHRFTEAGIPVLIASAPANEFTEPYFAMVNDEARSIVGPTADPAGVIFLEPARLWPNGQFANALHLDPNQAESYRAWLTTAIVAALGH